MIFRRSSPSGDHMVHEGIIAARGDSERVFSQHDTFIFYNVDATASLVAAASPGIVVKRSTKVGARLGAYVFPIIIYIQLFEFSILRVQVF